jgi:lysylphosphatidylglycerol synthetase-like protein (DUF2156 family)
MKLISRFTGIYYIVLGGISLGGSLISLALAYWTDRLALDLSFVIWFWLGHALCNRSSAARKWAIGIGILFITCLAAGITYGFFTGFEYSKVSMFGWEGPASPAMSLIVVSILGAVFAVPTIALLLPRARQEFASPKADKQEGAPVSS